VYKGRVIKLNSAAAQLVNFDSIRDMILGGDAREVITVRTHRKIKPKMRNCDGNGLAVADTLTLVSESEEKVYNVSFQSEGVLTTLNLSPSVL
jgi:hypothetical protein